MQLLSYIVLTFVSSSYHFLFLSICMFCLSVRMPVCLSLSLTLLFSMSLYASPPSLSLFVSLLPLSFSFIPRSLISHSPFHTLLPHSPLLSLSLSPLSFVSSSSLCLPSFPHLSPSFTLSYPPFVSHPLWHSLIPFSPPSLCDFLIFVTASLTLLSSPPRSLPVSLSSPSKHLAEINCVMYHINTAMM